jgi:hypothetical protein
MDKQLVHEMAVNLSQAMDGHARVETEPRMVLGREVVELRVFLLQPPGLTAGDQWIRLYCHRLATLVEPAGLELAADEWFTPSQRFPSCGCWIARPVGRDLGRKDRCAVKASV